MNNWKYNKKIKQDIAYFLSFHANIWKGTTNEGEEDVVITPGREGGTNALFLRKPGTV